MIPLVGSEEVVKRDRFKLASEQLLHRSLHSRQHMSTLGDVVVHQYAEPTQFARTGTVHFTPHSAPFDRSPCHPAMLVNYRSATGSHIPQPCSSPQIPRVSCAQAFTDQLHSTYQRHVTQSPYLRAQTLSSSISARSQLLFLFSPCSHSFLVSFSCRLTYNYSTLPEDVTLCHRLCLLITAVLSAEITTSRECVLASFCLRRRHTPSLFSTLSFMDQSTTVGAVYLHIHMVLGCNRALVLVHPQSCPYQRYEVQATDHREGGCSRSGPEALCFNYTY